MQQVRGLNLSETRHWSSDWLDVKVGETKKKTVSKHDIITEIIAQNSKPSISLFILTLVFTLPVVIFLGLAINVDWMFLIGVIVFGIFSGLMAWLAIDTEIQRRQKLKKAVNKNVNISFFVRTCTDKQWGEYGSEHISVVYQLFFGSVNYHVSKKDYDCTSINDSMIFVRVNSEELRIAYPLKYWDIEEE